MPIGTVRLHRVSKAPPARGDPAFHDVEATAKPLPPPHGVVCKGHALDAQVGGSFPMLFNRFATGRRPSFGGESLEPVPAQRSRRCGGFDDPSVRGAIVVTAALRAVSRGADPDIAQQGAPQATALETRRLGRQDSRAQRAAPAEPGAAG